jgi:hypothetical protein
VEILDGREGDTGLVVQTLFARRANSGRGDRQPRHPPVGRQLAAVSISVSVLLATVFPALI